MRGTSPPKPTPGIGEEGAFSPQARMRYIPHQKHTIEDVTSEEGLGGINIKERHAPVWRPLRYVLQIP